MRSVGSRFVQTRAVPLTVLALVICIAYGCFVPTATAELALPQRLNQETQLQNNALSVLPLENTFVVAPTFLGLYDKSFEQLELFLHQHPSKMNLVGSSLEASSAASPASSVLLDVPLVCQFPLAPSGCEIASLTMLLLYAGYPTTLEQSLDEMWYAYTPDEGFVGSPYGWDGLTIYPDCAGRWIQERLGSYQVLTGASVQDLCDVLRKGKPIVVWIIHPGVGEHCLCISGFDSEGFYLNDPYGEKDWFCDYELFASCWSAYNSMALSY